MRILIWSIITLAALQKCHLPGGGFGSGPCHAILTWDVATERNDGTPFKSTEVDDHEVNVQCGNESFTYSFKGQPACIPEELPSNTSCYFTIRTIDIYGNVSAPSVSISKFIQ